jgi:5'-nucleotidase
MSNNKQSTPSRVTIGISTSALFDMRDSDHIFRTKGPEKYQKHMIENEGTPFSPGHAFALVETMRDINRAIGDTMFDIVLISKNDMWSGIRAVKSLKHYDLPFSGAMFSGGRPTTAYLPAYNIDWFISTDKADVEAAARAGIAANMIDSPVLPAQAATMVANAAPTPKQDDAQPQNKDTLSARFNRKLHLVWDLDRVVLGPDADQVFSDKGVEYYMQHEREKADIEISDGPFLRIAKLVGEATRNFPTYDGPIISSALTARGGDSALRAMLSLREKGIVFNGMLHMTGGSLLKDGKPAPKGIYKDVALRIMRDEPGHTVMFLDDSERTIELTRNVVMSGLVPKLDDGLALGEKRDDKKPQPK